MTKPSYVDDVVEPVLKLGGSTGTGLRALVRGTGSIGARHARVLDMVGVGEISVWPVRVPSGVWQRDDLPASASLVSGYDSGPYDLVIIATDTGRHVADTLEALESGAHVVLLEKPAGLSVEDTRALAEHPRSGSVWVSAPLRFHTGFAQTKQLLPLIGSLHSVRVESQSWLPGWRPARDYRESYSARAEEGGVLRDLVHDIDYPLDLLGSPESVSAVLGHGILQIEAEESVDMIWQGPAVTSLRLDYTTPLKRRSILLVGALGQLSWDITTHQVTLIMNDGERRQWHFPSGADVDTALARQTLAVLERAGVSDTSVLQGFTPADLNDGILALAVCDAARKSASTGAAEPLK